MSKRLPDFLIVGAMKAGTSSFGADLGSHPEIFVARPELHFFNSEGRYSKGIDFYSDLLKNSTGKRIVGEKTPSYSYHPLVAKRISEHFPDIKLIWLFRDPVERAYSHYNFFVQRGLENKEFNEVIARERAGKNKHFILNYLDRSVYIKQLNRFLEYFKKEQMLFIHYQDYIRIPENTLHSASRFLGAGGDFVFPKKASEANITRMPYSKNCQFFLNKMETKIPMGKPVVAKLKRMNLRKQNGYPRLTDTTRKELQAFFYDYNKELEVCTGLDLGAWYN